MVNFMAALVGKIVSTVDFDGSVLPFTSIVIDWSMNLVSEANCVVPAIATVSNV